jgi:hypothetical protein
LSCDVWKIVVPQFFLSQNSANSKSVNLTLLNAKKMCRNVFLNIIELGRVTFITGFLSADFGSIFLIVIIGYLFIWLALKCIDFFGGFVYNLTTIRLNGVINSLLVRFLQEMSVIKHFFSFVVEQNPFSAMSWRETNLSEQSCLKPVLYLNNCATRKFVSFHNLDCTERIHSP